MAAAAAAHPGACARDAGCAKLADEARMLSKQGLLDAALISYQRAYALCSDPILLFNLARVYHRLGRREPAVANYKQYLLEAPDDDPAERQRAATFLAELAPESSAPAASAETKPTTDPKAQVEVKAAGPPPSDPSLVAPVPAASPSARRREPGTPVYKKWWLWTAVGLGVAAVATGVALGLAAREPDFGGASQFHPFGP